MDIPSVAPDHELKANEASSPIGAEAPPPWARDLDKLNNLRKKMEAIRELLVTDLFEMRDDIRTMKDDIRTMKDDIRTMKDDMRIMKDDVRTMKEDVKQLRMDVTALAEAIGDVKSDVTAVHRTIESL